MWIRQRFQWTDLPSVVLAFAILAPIVHVAEKYFGPNSHRLRPLTASISKTDQPSLPFEEMATSEETTPDAEHVSGGDWGVPTLIAEPVFATPTVPAVPPVRQSLRGQPVWRHDSEEESGDARRAYPEEVAWLRGRLARLKPRAQLNDAEQYYTLVENARYVGAIPYQEQSHGWGLPEDTVLANVGDCQDKSLLLAELLLTEGVEEVAVCRGVGPNYRPGEPGHAWVEARIAGRYYRIEATNGTVYSAGIDSHLDRHSAVATVWKLPANIAARATTSK